MNICKNCYRLFDMKFTACPTCDKQEIIKLDKKYYNYKVINKIIDFSWFTVYKILPRLIIGLFISNFIFYYFIILFHFNFNISFNIEQEFFLLIGSAYLMFYFFPPAMTMITICKERDREEYKSLKKEYFQKYKEYYVNKEKSWGAIGLNYNIPEDSKLYDDFGKDYNRAITLSYYKAILGETNGAYIFYGLDEHIRIIGYFKPKCMRMLAKITNDKYLGSLDGYNIAITDISKKDILESVIDDINRLWDYFSVYCPGLETPYKPYEYEDI